MEALINKLQKLEGGKVLDAATCFGGFIKFLAESLKSYDEFVGIDFSQKNLDKAEDLSKIKNVTLKQMDIHQLEFEDNSFDTVAIRFSIHHLRNIEKGLNEMHRVLKPNGLFILCEMHHDNLTPEQQNNTDFHHWRAEIDRLNNIDHYPTLSQQEIENHFKSLNLQDIECFDYISPDLDHQNYTPEFAEMCEQFIEEAKKYPERDDLITRGHKIIERIKEIGSDSAPVVFLLGRK